MTYHKNILLICFLLSAILSKAQGLKIAITDSGKSEIAFHCGAGNTISDNQDPLVVWSERKIPLTDFAFYYFNTSILKDIQVFKPGSDMAIKYGEAAKNGVIIITAKAEVNWSSARDIFQRKYKRDSIDFNNILLIIDGKKVSPLQNCFFAANIVTSSVYKDNEKLNYEGKDYKGIFYMNTSIDKLK